MDPKQQTIRNKQRERQQRGSDFQDEIQKSLRFVPNIWTINIKDGGGGTRPADRLILTEKANILAELKRTAGKRFNLSFLRPNQLQGLVDFDQVSKRNYGLIFISFHNPKRELDKAYAFRLITALQYMKQRDTRYIPLEDFKTAIPAIEFPRIQNSSYIYDLQEVVNCYKYL